MLRLVIVGSSIIALLTITGVGFAQVRNIAPYFGASGIAGPGGLGWGIEAGLRFHAFYAGLEGGAYSPLSTVNTGADVPIGEIPAPFVNSGQQFLGIHAGMLSLIPFTSVLWCLKAPNSGVFLKVILRTSSLQEGISTLDLISVTLA